MKTTHDKNEFKPPPGDEELLASTMRDGHLVDLWRTIKDVRPAMRAPPAHIAAAIKDEARKAAGRRVLRFRVRIAWGVAAAAAAVALVFLSPSLLKTDQPVGDDSTMISLAPRTAPQQSATSGTNDLAWSDSDFDQELLELNTEIELDFPALGSDKENDAENQILDDLVGKGDDRLSAA